MPKKFDPEKALYGIRADVYSTKGYPPGANHFIYGKIDTVTVIGPGIPQDSPASSQAPPVLIEESGQRLGSHVPHVFAVPMHAPPEGRVGWMNGGTFVWGHGMPHPVPLHDFSETPEDYRRYHD